MAKDCCYKGARIEKDAGSEADMALINEHTLSELSADDVFTFKIAMCDNRIDRDFEAFDEAALRQMASLFVGKTIIKDHKHSADNQIGRIYACEVDQPGGLSDTGEQYMQLVAKCYVLVNDANAPLISDIKGGIKKEVSVGFRLGSAICSICGTDNVKASCSHWWGREYDGKTCYFTLSGISDAYELSFVAVPAQRGAGTVKGYACDKVEEPAEPDTEKEAEEEAGKEGPECSDVGDDAEKQKEIEIRLRLKGAFIFEEDMYYEQENA